MYICDYVLSYVNADREVLVLNTMLVDEVEPQVRDGEILLFFVLLLLRPPATTIAILAMIGPQWVLSPCIRMYFGKIIAHMGIQMHTHTRTQ